MAHIKPTLRAILAANQAIAAIVEKRIHLGSAGDKPQMEYLLLTFTGSSRATVDGKGDSWRALSVEIASVAEDNLQATALADAVFACLNNYTGGELEVIEQNNESDSPNIDGSTDIFAVVQTYTIAGEI